jgi:transaldolase
MTKLHDLHSNGQSVWLDYIRRDALMNGELAKLVDNGIRGLTSNPTIFQHALAKSSQYDAQIAEILAADPVAEPATVFEKLAIADIRAAADLLFPVYRDSGGADGLVSLEVNPLLARDTEGTISEAHRLWHEVERPNLMIKVPATLEGMPAIEELIAAGVNVNVTLMFSLEDYENAAQAYLRGVARAEHPAGVASVASFFVSRVDTNTDEALDKVGTDEALAHRGKAAVANAKLAYRRYRELFEGPAFAAAAERGARPQRPLWASTSTKNPRYPDLLYVEPLVGPNTVNTMPPATIDAFIDHGEIDPEALTTDVDGAQADIDALAGFDIDFDQITAELQVDGVRKFADSYDDLLATVAEKMRTVTP